MPLVPVLLYVKVLPDALATEKVPFIFPPPLFTPEMVTCRPTKKLLLEAVVTVTTLLERTKPFTVGFTAPIALPITTNLSRIAFTSSTEMSVIEP